MDGTLFHQHIDNKVSIVFYSSTFLHLHPCAFPRWPRTFGVLCKRWRPGKSKVHRKLLATPAKKQKNKNKRRLKAQSARFPTQPPSAKPLSVKENWLKPSNVPDPGCSPHPQQTCDHHIANLKDDVNADSWQTANELAVSLTINRIWPPDPSCYPRMLSPVTTTATHSHFQMFDESARKRWL